MCRYHLYLLAVYFKCRIFRGNQDSLRISGIPKTIITPSIFFLLEVEAQCFFPFFFFLALKIRIPESFFLNVDRNLYSKFFLTCCLICCVKNCHKTILVTKFLIFLLGMQLKGKNLVTSLKAHMAFCNKLSTYWCTQFAIN